MVFARIRDLISKPSSDSPTTTSSSSSSSSAVLGTQLPYEDLHHHHTNNTNLRLSSSLQDLSSYHRLINTTNHLPQNPDLLPHPSFSKHKSSFFSSSSDSWLRFLFLFLSLLVFAFLLYLLALFLSSYWFHTASKFYVVLDCGSTGTRVYVYQASFHRSRARTLPIAVKPLTERSHRPRKPAGRAYDRMETEPGFHKLVGNVTGLNAVIRPLVKWAEKQIPRNAHKTTSVFVYATAGVRRLPPADSKWLLDNAWSILQASPFLCRREWIKTITGMEEAYFGWIALNYGTGKLGASPRKQTFGALDLGGSSLQVTFENERHMQSEANLDLRIGNVKHHLTAYSLPGYGLNDAFDKSVVRLFKKITKKELSNGKVEIKHPCLQTGYKESYGCSQCASTNHQQGGSPVVSEKSFGKSGIGVTLVGAPNWEECSALAKIAVNVSEWSNLSSGIDCDIQPCALADGFPHPFGHFYAISGFYVVYRFFNLTADATFDDALEKGRGFCESTWEVVKNSVAPQPFIEQYCFRAPYIVSLLREGLHITEKDVIVGSGNITWTLGVALSEAGKTLTARIGIGSYEILNMKISPLILMAVLVMSLICLLYALSCVGNWRPKFLRRSYLPLFRHNSASSASVLSIPSPFRFQRWSPLNSGKQAIPSGDGRAKMPLSPTVAGTQHRTFGFGHCLGSGSSSSSEIQLVESSLCPTSSVAHSYSSNNLGQMQLDGGSMASCWSPHRSQMRLQSRRSQSREDLNSSLAETHLVKV